MRFNQFEVKLMPTSHQSDSLLLDIVHCSLKNIPTVVSVHKTKAYIFYLDLQARSLLLFLLLFAKFLILDLRVVEGGNKLIEHAEKLVWLHLLRILPK